MPQHLLYGAYVRAVLKQVRREAVPYHVRRNPLRVDAARRGALLHEFEHAHAREWPPEAREEEPAGVFAADELRAQINAAGWAVKDTPAGPELSKL